MNGCFGGCLGRIVALLLLVLVVALLWRFGPDLADAWVDRHLPTASEDTSPELAGNVMVRYERLLAGVSEEILLTGAEVESLLRYSFEGVFPESVTEPAVGIADGEVRLTFLVERSALDLPGPDALLAPFPARLPMEGRGRLLPGSDRRALLVLHRVDLMGVPLPRRWISMVLPTVLPSGAGDLPPEAIPIALPPGVGEIRLDGDLVVIRATP
ncbi:MAG: hypothetical protein EA352_08600 [Gemmatimonadales bacterium]|nr:MAG: hypothetical protein EA352_08600 [Gemmatimonadales bacterium]